MKLIKDIAKANYFTSLLAGIITTGGMVIADHLKRNMGIQGGEINTILIVWGVVFFVLPFTIFIIGIDYFKYFFVRLKKLKFKHLFFPSDKEELKIMLRMIIWFVTTSTLMTLFHKLGK
jgi:hypothetical protein